MEKIWCSYAQVRSSSKLTSFKRGDPRAQFSVHLDRVFSPKPVARIGQCNYPNRLMEPLVKPSGILSEKYGSCIPQMTMDGIL